MRMTPRRKPGALPKNQKKGPKSQRPDPGKETVVDGIASPFGTIDFDKAHKIDTDLLHQSDIRADQATLKKLEAELAEKARAIDSERTKLKPLEDEIGKMRSAIRRHQDDLIVGNIDGLLAAVPEHIDRYGCTDEHHGDDDGNCTRCTLLYLKENPWEVPCFDIGVSAERKRRSK